jgi:COP9 signalosome complex subunit 4
MASLQSELAAIAALPDQKARVERYRTALAAVLAAGDAAVPGARTFLDHMLSDDVPLVVSRQLVGAFAQELRRLPSEAHKEARRFRR